MYVRSSASDKCSTAGRDTQCSRRGPAGSPRANCGVAEAASGAGCAAPAPQRGLSRENRQPFRGPSVARVAAPAAPAVRLPCMAIDAARVRRPRAREGRAVAARFLPKQSQVSTPPRSCSDFTASAGGGNELLTGGDASCDAAVAIRVMVSRFNRFCQSSRGGGSEMATTILQAGSADPAKILNNLVRKGLLLPAVLACTLAAPWSALAGSSYL